MKSKINLLMNYYNKFKLKIFHKKLMHKICYQFKIKKLENFK